MYSSANHSTWWKFNRNRPGARTTLIRVSDRRSGETDFRTLIISHTPFSRRLTVNRFTIKPSLSDFHANVLSLNQLSHLLFAGFLFLASLFHALPFYRRRESSFALCLSVSLYAIGPAVFMLFNEVLFLLLNPTLHRLSFFPSVLFLMFFSSITLSEPLTRRLRIFRLTFIFHNRIIMLHSRTYFNV